MFCARVREYLSQKQIQYDDHGHNDEPFAISELQKLGFMTTRVTVVGDKVTVGFAEAKLDEALAE